MRLDSRTLAALAVPLFVHLACGVGGEQIHWRSTDVELVGRLVLPTKVQGPFPLAIFVSGSGCMESSHKIYRDHARELSERGVAVFIADKRGCGSSGGDWRDVGLEELADDILAIVPELSARTDIDQSRVGLLGLSQGGWVSIIAAGKSDAIAFVIMLSGTPLTPAEQGTAIVEMALRAKGYGEEAIAEAVALDRQILEVYRTDAGWDEARAATKAAADRPWFADAGVGMQPREMWNWRWLRGFMDYDPRPALERLEIPILAVFGELDRIVPPERSKMIIDALTPIARGSRETVLLPGVGHQLRAGKGEDWSPAYWQALETWFTKHEIRAAASR